MKNSLLPYLGAACLIFVPTTHGQLSYGGVSVGALAAQEEPEGLGVFRYEEMDSPSAAVEARHTGDFASVAHGRSSASYSEGRLIISADTSVTTGDGFIEDPRSLTENTATLQYRDTVWFYSPKVTYGAPLEVHFRVRLIGDFSGFSEGTFPGGYSTIGGQNNVRVALLRGDEEQGVTESFTFQFDGPEHRQTGVTDAVFDLHWIVRNSELTRYDLAMSMDFFGRAEAMAGDPGTGPLQAGYSFDGELVWDGLISARSLYGGVPLTGQFMRSRNEIDYQRSYSVPPLNGIPEPSTYGLVTAALLLVGAAGRRWKRSRG